MLITPLNYLPDSADLFTTIATLPWAIFLDSGFPYQRQGRFDIMSACPYITLTTRGLNTVIQTIDHTIVSQEDPFSLVKKYLQQTTCAQHTHDLPFTGGALGYFAYDLARRIEKLPVIAQDDLTLPDMMVGIYDWAIIVDHLQQKTWLVQQQNATGTAAIGNEVLHRLTAKSVSQIFTAPILLNDFQSNFTAQTYAEAFQQVQRFLQNGDCYQINLAQRFSAPICGSAWSLYKTLRQYNSAPFSAFFHTPEVDILSLSPERFLRVTNKVVETKPIKGTRPRGVNSQQDKQLAEELLNSEKDRAENVMIVDLLRNDLSKTCEPFSVKVPQLCVLESFSAVHHLVSTVTGKLVEGNSSLDLLRGCFPGGSITGAPKVRAMEIIESLEPHRRYVYCGGMGYIDYSGNMDVNVAIRTLIWRGSVIYCYAGGGITIDSELEAEYAETLAKIAVILRVLNKFK